MFCDKKDEQTLKYSVPSSKFFINPSTKLSKIVAEFKVSSERPLSRANGSKFTTSSKSGIN